MPTDEATLIELLGRFVVTNSGETGHPAPTDRSHPSSIGTWTIDPTDSSVSLAWRKLRHWAITSRRSCVGVIHVDELPPVGVIRFEQPSGLPVLTIALEPATVDTGGSDVPAMLRGPDLSDTLRHRWWTLRSESLEVLPGGTLRVMATLTAQGITGLIELRFEIDRGASDREWLVLSGQGVLDRRAFGTGRQAPIFYPKIQLDLAVHARRARTRTSPETPEGTDTPTTSWPPQWQP